MDQVNQEFFDAAAAGDFGKVCAQVSKGADVNVRNGDGRTALMRSAKRGYEDIVRFFGGVVIRQQRYIEALQKDINTLKESRLEAAKGLEDANVDEETKKILQSLSEQIINQQKDIQRALENSEKIDAVRDKNQEVKVRSLTVGNELIDLRQDYDALQKETKKDSKAIRQESKERDKELKAMIRELEQTSLWFRLRRKWRHITGKDK